MDKEYKTSPLKAIRAKCMDCSGNLREEIRNCPVKACDLWPYRFGKNPYRKKREISPEQRAQMAARLAKSRKRKNQKREVEK